MCELAVILAAALACTPTQIELGGNQGDSRAPVLVGDSGGEDLPGDTSVAAGDSGDTGLDTGPKVFDHLPVLRIDAHGAIGDGTKTRAELEVIEEHDGTLRDLDTAPVAYAGPIGIELHGSSSLYYPKYGYRFECRDETEQDVDCPLVGLSSGHDWVLVANYSDKSYVRNAMAYGMARDVAADREAWEVGTQFIELFIDDDYLGIYLLVERVERDGQRLDFTPTTNPETGDVDGGFIVKIDQHRSDGFDTSRGTPIDWSDPQSSDITTGERRYIQGWFEEMEGVFASNDYADPAAGYGSVIDVDGWIDHWLINELTHNIDAYRLSTYHWTSGPFGTDVMHAGPVWDFDRAFGNVNYYDCWNTYGWIVDDLSTASCGAGYQFPFWWARLDADPLYHERLNARWSALRADVLSDAAIEAKMDTLLASLAEAEPRDQQTWRTMGVAVDPNYYVGATWGDEIAWLKLWLVNRAAWMDGELQ